MKTRPNKPIGSHAITALADVRNEKGELEARVSTTKVPRYSKADIEAGEEFRDLRNAAGLTLGDVARKLGVSPALISSLEHGAVSPATAEDEDKLLKVLSK